MLKPQEFEQLWTAYLSGEVTFNHSALFDFCAAENYNDFWAVNNKLMANARGELEPFKNIPFVVYEVVKHDLFGCIPIENVINVL